MRIFFLGLFFSLWAVTPVWAGNTYVLDKAHSSISFSVSHMMVSKTTGGFKEFDGTILFSPNDLSGSAFEFVVKAGSIDTDQDARDNHLRGADFFDVEKYPEMVFRSKRLTSSGEGRYILTGDLTLKDVTREVAIPVTILGPVPMPSGSGSAIGITAQFQINRQDYHVNFNKKLDNGGLMVGDLVDVVVNLEAHAQ